jgi:translocation and assembly module TamB
MSDTPATDAAAAPPAPPASPPPRRWLRRTVAALLVLAVLLGAGVWLLGRESTLQTLVQKVADASGGKVVVTGVSGSLYGAMHIGHLRYSGPDSVITADQLDIAWSPLQLLSEGIAISDLHVARLQYDSIGPGKPPVLPASLAPPFRLAIGAARIDQLTLRTGGAAYDLAALRFQLTGERSGWQLRDAGADTPWGRLAANGHVAASRPFALEADASLTQTTPPAGQSAAKLTAQARGDLSLLELNASGTSPHANGEAKLTLAPFDPVMLRTLRVDGRGIDPSRFDAAWPQAALRLDMTAAIDPQRRVTGRLALINQGAAGPLDQHKLPLQSVQGQLGGTLDNTAIDAVLIDLGKAGQLRGGGVVGHGGPQAAPGRAEFALRAERIDLKAIHGSMKTTRIAGDIKLASDAKTQTLNALLADAGLRLELRATLADALVQLQQARLQAGKGSIDLTGQIGLKDARPLHASASVAHFDPAALGAYPAADLNADGKLDGQLAPDWKVAAALALRPSSFSGQPLSGAAKLTADAKHLSGIDAKFKLGQNALDLHGDFGAPGEQVKWRLDAPKLAALRGDLSGAAAASGALEGTLAAPRSSFAFEARGLGLAASKHPAPASVLRASGEVALVGAERRLEVSRLGGALQGFSPAAFGPYPAGDINADVKGGVRLGADWRLALDLALRPSTLGEAPLSGHARFTAAPGRVENTELDLRLGANNLTASGGFGAARDRLDWKLDAPKLASLGPQFGGALRGSGVLSGSAAAPSLGLALDGAELLLPGAQRIKTLRASASLGSGQGGADALTADVEVAGYSGPKLTLASARLQTRGTRAAHTLQLAARGDNFDAAAQVAGGWSGDTWNGHLEQLENRGRFAFALQAPVALRLAGPSGAGWSALLHPEQIALANAVFKVGGGTVQLQNLDKNGARWRSSGAAANLPLAWLAQLAPALRENASGDLTLGAQWSLDVQAPAAGRDAQLAGMLRVYREKGDLALGGDLPLALGLRTLEARAEVAGDALRLQFQLDGARAGQLRLGGSVRMVGGRVAGDSALDLTGSADMRSLAWLAPLSGQPGLELDGALHAALTAAGSIDHPRLSGEVRGENLTLNWAEQGVKLRNGQLQAQLAGDQLQLTRLAFDGVEGRVQAEGALRFANAEASMELRVAADKLRLLSRPDRLLVVSGRGALIRDQKRLRLEGKFTADRARIELAAQNTPTLSDDVVVLGKGGKRPAAPGAGLPLSVDVEADLGEAFYLKGKGLDARLAGSVRVRLQERGAPRATGNIRVVEGTYDAYGQKLTIERGVINFSGAYDNPGLNILAVRKRPEGTQLADTNVEAGVEVHGTALAPQARLVSTPNVPDSEKLAWLVLGHGTEGSAGNELGLLTTAAGALFGGGQGGSLQSRLAGSLGLDELGLSQAKGLESTVVTVGKRLSQRAYLSFEQGAGAATSLVKLRYKLNERITLQLQTGANSAIDVLYTWAFD